MWNEMETFIYARSMFDMSSDDQEEQNFSFRISNEMKISFYEPSKRHSSVLIITRSIYEKAKNYQIWYQNEQIFQTASQTRKLSHETHPLGPENVV